MIADGVWGAGFQKNCLGDLPVPERTGDCANDARNAPCERKAKLFLIVFQGRGDMLSILKGDRAKIAHSYGHGFFQSPSFNVFLMLKKKPSDENELG